jgi:hypothetical protein
LCDKERVQGILEQAGFVNISITPFDFPLCFAHEGGVAAAVPFCMQIGPTGAALAEVGKEAREIAAGRLATALAPFERNGDVSLGAAIWWVEAVRGESTDSDRF